MKEVTFFDTSGTFGSVHCLQLRNQPIHLPSLQFKFTKSTDDHQACQITFRISANISDQKLHLSGVFTVTEKSISEIAALWPFARQATTFPGDHLIKTSRSQYQQFSKFQTSVRDVQETASLAPISFVNLICQMKIISAPQNFDENKRKVCPDGSPA